jgi:hypothetical protein
VFLNKWYPVTGLDNVGDLLIPSGDKSDDVGYRESVAKRHFDLSNPCDFDPNMPEAINPKYKVGDEVVVVDNERVCPTYTKAFWYFGLKDKQSNDLQERSKATITGISYSKINNFNLYALRDSEGNECVIGEEGIKLAGIDKQEWFDTASRLFDSWMKISGGYVPEDQGSFNVFYMIPEKKYKTNHWKSTIEFPFLFKTREQAEKFGEENEKDLKTFWHQV